MLHVPTLKHRRIGRWMVGLAVAATLGSGSIAFIALDGGTTVAPRTEQHIAAPAAESISAAPVSGPWELYHAQGAPPMQSVASPEDDVVPTLWELYHCGGCP